MDNQSEYEEELRKKKERIARQLAQVVCICKGIKLSKVLEELKNSDTLEEVNRKTGCGSGGCQGERCGPKIRALLHKKKNKENK